MISLSYQFRFFKTLFITFIQCYHGQWLLFLKKKTEKTTECLIFLSVAFKVNSLELSVEKTTENALI